jgi:hypothetical protein
LHRPGVSCAAVTATIFYAAVSRRGYENIALQPRGGAFFAKISQARQRRGGMAADL